MTNIYQKIEDIFVYGLFGFLIVYPTKAIYPDKIARVVSQDKMVAEWTTSKGLPFVGPEVIEGDSIRGVFRMMRPDSTFGNMKKPVEIELLDPKSFRVRQLGILGDTVWIIAIDCRCRPVVHEG